VVIFTKFDSIEGMAFRKLKQVGLTLREARVGAPAHADEEFKRNCLPQLFGAEHQNYICLRNMHKGLGSPEIQKKMADLIQKTVESLNIDALKFLLVSVQKNNLQLTIEYAVKYGPIEGIAKEVSATGTTVTKKQLNSLIWGLLLWFSHIIDPKMTFEDDQRGYLDRLQESRLEEDLEDLQQRMEEDERVFVRVSV